MAQFGLLFRCLGEAVLSRGVRGLAGLVPLGEVLFDVAENALERYQSHQNRQDLRVEVGAVAQAAPDEVKKEASRVAQEVAAGQPDAVVQALVQYLTQVPAAVRQSLKRPSDPTGTTAPPNLRIERAEQLLPLLPSRLPRFSPGDRPTPGGAWVLAELLGVGGFGEVWRAEHPQLKGITAALKFCLDPTAVSTLRHEAALLNQVMQQTRHPGIVPLRQAYLDHDPVCLEYEYVPGGDLANLVRDGRGGPPAKWIDLANRLLLRLATIVGHAHRLRPPVVHRDLKPANILIQKREAGKLDLRVTDFGIGGIAASHALTAIHTGTSTRGDLLAQSLRGAHTPLYASPQQVRGEAPDPRDDVYSLGVIWYQLASANTCQGISADFAEDLREPGMSEPLIALLGRCVAGKAERRPADAAVLAEELARLLRPTPARTPAPQRAPVAPPAAPPTPAAAPPPPEPVGEIRCFKGHTKEVHGVAFSPDGRFVLSGSHDESVRLWDVTTGREVCCLEGHKGPVCSVAISRDGRWAVSGSQDSTVRLWDLASRKEWRCFKHPTMWWAYGVAISGDNRQLLYSCTDGTVHLWDVSTGSEVRRFEGHRDCVRSVAFLPDGRQVLSASEDGTVRLWEVATGKQVHSFRGHTDEIEAMALAPDGSHFVSGGRDRTLRLWDVARRRELLCLPEQWVILAVALSPDGRLALTGGKDDTVALWDLRGQQKVHTFSGHQPGWYIQGVAFSPDGRYGLSGSGDKTLRLWRLPNEEQRKAN